MMESIIKVTLKRMESSTWNPESMAWNPKYKTVFDFLTWCKIQSQISLHEAIGFRAMALSQQWPNQILNFYHLRNIAKIRSHLSLECAINVFLVA